MKTVVIVPYRPDHGHRDQLWRYLREHYWAKLPYKVLIGEHLRGPFNRSAAINTAARSDWDVAVIADSDTWVPAAQLHDAVAQAHHTGRMTSALTAVVEISQRCTLEILADRLTLAGSFEADRVRTRDMETQSSMLAVPRALWDRFPLFDERFHGWGGEDSAAWRAAEILGGTVDRVSGNSYHLWHQPAAGKFRGPEYRRNFQLWQRYRDARTEQDLRRIASA